MVLRTSEAAPTESTETHPSTPDRRSCRSSPTRIVEAPHTEVSSSTKAPLYTQEQVAHLVRAALTTYHDQQQYRQRQMSPHRELRRGASAPNMAGRRAHPYSQALNQQRPLIMKPRIHAFEHFGPPSMMIVTLELPGLAHSDVSVNARPTGELVIQGNRPTLIPDTGSGVKPNGRVLLNELKFGQFERVFVLPPGTNPAHVTANMVDGMLTVTWPLPTSQSSNQLSPDREVKQENEDQEPRRLACEELEEGQAGHINETDKGTDDSHANAK